MLWIIGIFLVVAITAMIFMPLVTKPGSSMRIISVVLGIIAPLVAIMAYLAIGSPTAVDADTPPKTSESLEPINAPPLGSVEMMAAQLHKRLIENSDDARGWTLLARSYDYMNKPEAAEAARQRALALTADPGDQQDRSTPVSLHGTIALAPGLADKLEDTDTVYVFASAANGPRMPLAARRYSAKELPVEFILNESHTLSSARPLSSEDSIVVGVKISKTGDALNTASLLVGSSLAVSPHEDKALHILIREKPIYD